MSTRFRLGISTLIVGLFATIPAHAQGAVTVVGGGMAQACYEAVEYSRVPAVKAMEVCDLAIEQENLKRRDRAATYTNRGILAMRAGNNTRALWDYQNSLRLMPELKEAKVNLGAAYYNLKRYDEALAALNEGVGTENIEAKAIGYYNRGLTNEKLGDIQSAYEDFRQAYRLMPNFTQASEQMQRFTVVPANS